MAELSTIARPYAEAAYAAAKQAADLPAWQEALNELAQIVSLPKIQELLANPKLDNDQRVSLLKELVSDSAPEHFDNFINVIVEQERWIALPSIAEQFRVLKNRAEGSATAKIISAFELSESQVQELLSDLQQKFNVTLKPEVSVDPSLIGGVRVEVGDQVLDTSVQAQLTRLRHKLAAD
ncbi:F0F1 ATP synthase subunit delta [Brackiella oedipodis]|uniref:F0F1 ATP synthase subunit delta n=1 Tax=Brackiella oedipodis TaxID=124225 RepID=UPI00048B2E82|nr:F0F1 ATP synthase subunit delta [Brackiella oedipodis]